MTLEVNFRLPLMREFLLSVGVTDASQEACFRLLGRGNGAAIMLAVGGAQESLLCQPGTIDLVGGAPGGRVRGQGGAWGGRPARAAGLFRRCAC
jgi:hypothetical protein